MAIFKRPRLALTALAAIHLVAAFPQYSAPYDPARQNRDLPYAPPTTIHILDERGGPQHPFVYALNRNENGAGYHENRIVAYPIHFFLISGAPLLPPNQQRRHLFGVDEPGAVFLMGTDAYGRDQFSRLIYGSRISLFAGLLATIISVGLGIALGSLAGFYGRGVDECVMRISEICLSLPWLYLLFAVRAALPLEMTPNQLFMLFIAIIGAIGWARPARLIRGVVLSVKEREYVQAARTFGGSGVYLLRRHILPQIVGVALAQAAILLPRYILAEVVLSFFGLGVSEPAPSWGNLLAALRQYQVLQSYWWMFLPLAAVLATFVAYYDVCSYYVYRFASSTIKDRINAPFVGT